MKYLEQDLGRALTTKQVALFLNINEKTVRDYYLQFGGIKIGRHYRFFERSIIDAIQAEQKQIHSTDQEGRTAEGEGISNAERGQKVGSRNAKYDRRGMEREDRHGLLD